MPLVVTVVYAFSARWVHILPEGFTLHYIAATLTNQKFLLGIGRGLLISFVPVVITNVSVLLALYAVIVYLPGLEKVVQLLCLIPTTLNGIILATSVLGTYAGTNTLLANRIVMLSFIYCVFIMPMTYQGLRNSLYAVNTRGLLEAAVPQLFDHRSAGHPAGALQLRFDVSFGAVRRFRHHQNHRVFAV